MLRNLAAAAAALALCAAVLPDAASAAPDHAPGGTFHRPLLPGRPMGPMHGGFGLAHPGTFREHRFAPIVFRGGRPMIDRPAFHHPAASFGRFRVAARVGHARLSERFGRLRVARPVGRFGFAAPSVHAGRSVLVNRVVYRGGRRVVISRPYPVFFGGAEPGPAVYGPVPFGAAPRLGCSIRRSVSPATFGLRRIVTVRTCLVP